MDSWRGEEEEKMRYEYIKCPHCGFPCRVNREVSMPRDSRVGDGISYERVSGISAEKYEPVVNGGCPFCGTYLWDEGTYISDEDEEA